MGQRSQIYVRYEVDGNKILEARYFGWNYGERMISRVRHTMEWLEEYSKYPFSIKEKLYRIIDTNFDMKDVVISSDIFKEWKEGKEEEGWGDTLNNFLFYGQDNNDGKVFIDLLENGDIKYAFLDYDCENVMDAEQYMAWDICEEWQTPTEYRDEETIETCSNNISYINDNAKLMTEEEVREFIGYDYSQNIQ